MTTRSRIMTGVIATLILLIAARAALPFIVKDQVNKRLEALENYTGHIDDIDIALWRGEYAIRHLVVEKTDAATDMPFLVVPEMAISLQWGALFEGRIVGEAELYGPELSLATAEDEARSQIGDDEPWYELLEDLVPFTVNRLAVYNGYVHFQDISLEDDLELYVTEVQAQANNLSNVEGTEADTFADLQLTGLLSGETPLAMSGELSPLARPPAFELNFELETLPLTGLNGLLNAYASVDAESGTFSVYAEFASADGEFEGYIKPVIEDAEFVNLEEDEGLLRKFWEAAIGLTAEVFENQPEDQVASQIPLSGELEQIDAGILPAVLSILENAFIEALEAQIDDSVELENLGGDSQGGDDSDGGD